MRNLPPFAIVLAGLLLLLVSERYLAGHTWGVRKLLTEVSHPGQIAPITDAYVRPVLYNNIRGLSELPADKAKQTFINAVLPAVLVAKHDINMLRLRLQRLRNGRMWTHSDSVVFSDAQRRFGSARTVDELLRRVGTLPNSIVLAQAAVESGWGQSRIFLEGNNLFGIWSFDPNEPRIAAGQARGSKTIWLRTYPDMSESIVGYFEVLSRSNAFRSLRQARIDTTDPLSLLPHLRNFSERRGAYTRQLRTMIEQNDLTRFDDYVLDPEYLYEN